MPLELTNFSPEVIIFGGLTLIGLSLVGLLFRLMKFYGNHTNDVINRNTDAWVKNSATNQRLSDVIEKWHLLNGKDRKKYTK